MTKGTQVKRQHLFTMRLSDEEHERQQRVAAFYNMSVADILRLMVLILDEASKGRKEGDLLGMVRK